MEGEPQLLKAPFPLDAFKSGALEQRRLQCKNKGLPDVSHHFFCAAVSDA
jgi:hypothetical protein